MNHRLEKVQKLLPVWGVDLLLITNPRDLFYLTGQELSRGTLLVSLKEIVLIVDGRYFEGCKQRCSCTVLKESPAVIENSLKAAHKIGFDGDEENFNSYQKLSTIVPVSNLVPLTHPILTLRSVKDLEEIKKITAACELCCLGFDYIVSQIHEGVTERKLAQSLEIFWKEHDADQIAFNAIIGFGPNSALPHHRAGTAQLVANELILIDIGVVLDGYNSDMTRMVYFGEVSSSLQEICTVVERAQKAAVDVCKPGVLTSELDSIARKVIADAGFSDYFVHGLGHGVGLDIHELPVLKKSLLVPEVVLEEGMVITIEPGIYLPGIGGARIEDTLVVSKNGTVNLIDRPHSPVEIVRK